MHPFFKRLTDRERIPVYHNANGENLRGGRKNACKQ